MINSVEDILSSIRETLLLMVACICSETLISLAEESTIVTHIVLGFHRLLTIEPLPIVKI